MKLMSRKNTAEVNRSRSSGQDSISSSANENRFAAGASSRLNNETRSNFNNKKKSTQDTSDSESSVPYGKGSSSEATGDTKKPKMNIFGALNKAKEAFEMFDDVFDVPEELGLKRNMSTGKNTEGQINVDILDKDEQRRLRKKLLEEFLSYTQDGNINTPFKYEESETAPLDLLITRVSILKNESEVTKAARKKESYFFVSVYVICLLVRLTGVDISRIANAQEKNKPQYLNYFKEIARNEVRSEGTQDPFKEMVFAAGITLICSVAALIAEKYAGTGVADIIESTATAAFSDGIEGDPTQNPSNPLIGMLKSLAS